MENDLKKVSVVLKWNSDETAGVSNEESKKNRSTGKG